MFNERLIVKIHEGTRSDSGDLCRTCRFGHVMKGAADSQESVRCGQLGGLPVKIRVASCNRYLPANQMTVSEMLDIAWVLQTKKVGKDIGFLSPEQRRKLEGSNNLPQTSY